MSAPREHVVNAMARFLMVAPISDDPRELYHALFARWPDFTLDEFSAALDEAWDRLVAAPAIAAATVH